MLSCLSNFNTASWLQLNAACYLLWNWIVPGLASGNRYLAIFKSGIEAGIWFYKECIPSGFLVCLLLDNAVTRAFEDFSLQQHRLKEILMWFWCNDILVFSFFPSFFFLSPPTVNATEQILSELTIPICKWRHAYMIYFSCIHFSRLKWLVCISQALLSLRFALVHLCPCWNYVHLYEQGRPWLQNCRRCMLWMCILYSLLS